MFQELIDAINRLRQAADNDKPKHGQFAAGAIAGGLAGGITGTNIPNHSWSYVAGLSVSQLEDWADDVEAVDWVMPSETGP